MGIRTFGRQVVLAAVVALPLLLACSRVAIEEGNRKFPEYTEGGTITLNASSQQVTVTIQDALFNNTDPGYPESIELWGPGTYIYAEVPTKIHDGEDGLSDYKPILNQPQKILMQGEQPCAVDMPGIGKYPILDGALTLEKYDHGMNGRVLWEGKMELTVQTSAGPMPVWGTFKIVMVPVW